MQTVLSILGTRPEAIKMAPVVKELERHPDHIRSIVCVTAQHRQMLDQVLSLFKITPQYDLNLMKPDQSIGESSCRYWLTTADLRYRNPAAQPNRCQGYLYKLSVFRVQKDH